MSFLQKLWQKLKEKKAHEKPNKKMHFEEVFKGFRTIPIQQLSHIKNTKKGPLNKKATCEFQGCKTVFYEENAKGTYEVANGFFFALYDAYINHGEVKITPDDVWIAILQWFAAYASRNSSKIRKMLTSLQLECSIGIKIFEELKESQMEEVYDSILLEIRKNTMPGVIEKIQCAFSTTTKLYRLFSSAVIANSMSESKNVSLELIAGIFGIQKVHMGGRVEDWERLIWKLLKLSDFDVDGQLKKYRDGLKPILDQLLETFKGYPHLEFWNSICQEKFFTEEQSQSQYHLNGWLIKFFTTSDDRLQEFPSSKIGINICVNKSNTQKFRAMNLLAGSRAVTVEKNVYRPHFQLLLVTERGKTPAEQTPRTRAMEKRESSQSMNHQAPTNRPKTCSLPKNLKIAEKAVDMHLPTHHHLRQQFKIPKINMGELFEQTFHLQLPQIHIKKGNPFAHPSRH